MAKKPKAKAPKTQTPGTGTGAQTGGPPPNGQTPPPQTLWSGKVLVDDVIKSLPNYGTSNFAATPAGIQAWLVANGVDPMQVADWMSSPTGTADMLAFTNDPNKFKGDMSGMAQQNVAGASTATDAMNATPTAPGGKPLTGQQLRKMTEGIAQGMNNVGNLKKLEVQTPGLRVTARTRRPDPASSQTSNPAPGTTQTSGGQTSGAGATPPAPTPMTPFWDQVEADRQSYRDRNVDPPAWIPATTAIKRNYPNILGGAAVLGAIGAAGYGYGLGSSSGEQKGPVAPPIIPPNDEQMLRRMMEEEMRGPMPQQNPAGTPPPNNSTLMRVMNSRSV